MRLFILVLCLVSALPAAAQERERPPVEFYDVWSEPNPGIRYLRRVTTAPCTIHVLEIDLRHDGVDVRVSGRDERWQTVGDHARTQGAAVAVNGGFWETFAQPAGLHVTDDEPWEDTADNYVFGFLGFGRNGRAFISPPEEVLDPVPDRILQGTSGRPMLVRDGEVDTESLDPVATANMRQPRTAAAVSRTGNTLWLLVTDGRQEHSVGLTMYELARTLAELGAHRALNLDGGGSSTLFVERLGGVMNAPSGSRWEEQLGFGVRREEGEVRRSRRTKSGREMVYVRGVEREVMNAITITAPSMEGLLAPMRAPLDAPLHLPEVVTLPPRQSWLHAGRIREWARPAAFALGGLLLFAFGRKMRRKFHS